MAGQPFNNRKLKPPTSGIANNDYAANFEDFLNTVPKDKAWSFWYGGLEPHRGYEYGSGVKQGGKRLSDIDRVPGHWPDNETVRHDMLDYAFEVEHFDLSRAREEMALAGHPVHQVGDRWVAEGLEDQTIEMWLTEGEYSWLKSEASESDDTISAVIRRIIRAHRSNVVASSHDAGKFVTRVHKK